MRRRPFVVRSKAAHHEQLFRKDVLATVEALGMVTETDLMDSLRGSTSLRGLCRPSLNGVRHWSFGAYDFRAMIGRLVSDGLLVEHQGRQRGGGIQTTYVLGKATTEVTRNIYGEVV